MSLANSDLTVLFQQISVDPSSVLLIFNITFIVVLVLAALIGLVRGVWRAGFRFLFVVTALVTLWFLSPGIIETLLDYPVKSILQSQGWETDTLRELPAYLVSHGNFSEELKAIFSNADLQALLLGIIQAILTFVVFFVGGLLIILLSWPFSTLLYAFIRFVIPKKWRKEHKVRWAGALFGLVQALVSFSVLLMPLSVVNNALENIDRQNLQGNKEILTIYDLGKVYGDSFAGQLFSLFSLPFSKTAKTQLWASDKLLTMKFKSNSIVLTDEIDVFMSVFDELLKAGVVDIIFEADTGLTVYFNANIGNYQLPSGAIGASNKGTLESLLNGAKLGNGVYDYYGTNPAFNPYLWDYTSINNQFNLPYFQNGYVYEGGQLVVDPTYQMVAYLAKLGFEFNPGAIDAATLKAYIETYLPHVDLTDPNTWNLGGSYTASSIYNSTILQKIISTNLPHVDLGDPSTWGIGGNYTVSSIYDIAVLQKIIEANLPDLDLLDPKSWGIGNLTASSIYDIAVLQKIIDANLPMISTVPLIFNPLGGSVPTYGLDLASYFNLGASGSLAAIMAANLPYFNINFNTWEGSVSSGNIGNITLPSNGSITLDNSLTEDLLNLISPDLAKEILRLLSESDLIVNTLPVALNIALTLPALQDYIDASKINPSDIELTPEEWAAELVQLGEVASLIVDLDVIRDVLSGGNDYFGYDPEKVERIGFEFAKLKLVNTILPVALPAVLPNIVPEEYYEGLGLADIDFSSYNWEVELQKISTMAANALKLDLQGIVDGDIDYFTQDPAAVSKILTTLTQSEIIMDIIPRAINYALDLDVVKEYTKDVDIDLSEVDWAAEIVNLGSVYAEIAKVGGNPLDVKWGLTDEETAAKAAAIEAAIDLLFSSQLINGLLPTLSEIGINYLEDPFKDAVDTGAIDFENLNLPAEVKNAFRAYRLVINEDGSFNDKILTYSDEKIRQLADFIGNSDIIVPLLPNAIVVLGAEFGIDEFVDLNKEDFEGVNWADTIYNLVGVAKYFIDEENQPDVDILSLTEADITDIATRINGVPLIKKLLPSALSKLISGTDFAKYYNEDLINFDELELGTEIGHVLRLLQAVGFEFDFETQDFNFNLNFTTYTDEMIAIIETALNTSKLLKDLSPALLEFAQDQLPAEYKDLINLKDIDLSNLGTEIANIIKVIKAIGGEIDIGNGTVKLNLDFASYTDEMIETITTLLGSSSLLDQLFRTILGALEKIIKDEFKVDINLDDYVTDDINIGTEVGTLIKVARELKLKISEDFKEIDYDIKLAHYEDARIDRLAKAVGDSALINNLLPAAVDIAVGLVDEKYAKLIDKDAYDFDSVDLERDIKYLLKAARLFVTINNEIKPVFKYLTDSDVNLVAEAIGGSTLFKMIIGPTMGKLADNAEELFGIDIAKYVDLSVIEDYSEVDWVNEFDSIIRIARAVVDTDEYDAELNFKIKYKTTEEEREDIAYAIDKMTLIEELLPSALENIAKLEELKAVKDYIDLTDIDLDKISLGNEVKGALEVLSYAIDDPYKLEFDFETIKKDGLIDAVVRFVNGSALIKEVATLAYDNVYDKFELSKYISRSLIDFEEIELGTEIKPFLLVAASVIKDNMIDERLEIDDDEYAAIEEAFNDATIIPAVIKDVKGNMRAVLNNVSSGLGDTIVKFFDPEDYDIESYMDWGKEITSLIKIATQIIDVRGNSVSLDLLFTDTEIGIIGNAINDSQLITRAVETALMTVVTNQDLYKGFLPNVDLFDYYNPRELKLATSGILGEDVKQLLTIAREFITIDHKFEFNLSEIKDSSYSVIASSINKLQIVRHALESIAYYPHEFTFNGKTIKLQDYVTFDDYFDNYDLGSDVVKLMKAATVFVDDDFKVTIKMQFTTSEMQLLASNIGNLKLLKMAIEKGIDAAVKYFEIDEELVDELELDDLDLVNEIYQLLRVVNVLDIDLDNPSSMLDLTEAQYNEIGDAVSELKLVNKLLPVAAVFALSYFAGNEIVDEIDIDDIDFDKINLGDEFIRIFKILSVLDFEVVNENGKLGVKFNTVINSYTSEDIDIIADQLGNSELVKQLLPIAAKIGVKYIPADYKVLVDLDLIDFEEIDLEAEIANIVKAAVLFFDDENKLVIDFEGLTDEKVNTIAKVGKSAFIKMLVNHAVYSFVDEDMLSKFGVNIKISDYVDLKSIDYSAIDFEVELRSILNIARQVLIIKDMKFDYTLDLDADQRAVIETSINSSELIEKLLESAVDVLSTNDMIKTYVDLIDLDLNEIDLGREISRLLEITSYIAGADGKLILELKLIQDDYLVELIANVLNDSNILKQLAPSAVDKLFDNQMLTNAGIKLSDYLDQSEIDVTEVKWGDEIKPFLYAVGALTIVDNVIYVDSDITDEDFDKIATALNESTLIPQLIVNAHGNAEAIIRKLAGDNMFDVISNFLDISALDLANGINWGNEIIGLVKIAYKLVEIKTEDSKYKFELVTTISDDIVETVRDFINDSELITRVAENAIETSINNPNLLGMFLDTFKDVKISDYVDLSDLDLRGTHKLGDEIANVLYIARNFVTEDFKITLDLGILDEEMFEIIETNINNSTLIPYLINTAAHVAVDSLGFSYQDVEVMVKSLVNLDDVDLLSIEYGSEIVKFLRSAMIFKVYGKNQFELTLRLTENDILTIADNVGTSELLQIALEKGIIAGLKLFGLDDEITLDDIKFDEFVIRDEIYHLLSAVRILEIDLDDIIGSLNLSIIDVENISSHLSESKILKYVAPVAIEYVIEHSEELFKIDVNDYIDTAYLDLDEIDWADEITMVLALVASMVDNYSGEFVIDLNISEAEADFIESSINKSNLLPQVIPYFMDNIDKYVAASIMDIVANFVDVSALDLVDGVNLGKEIVALIKVANEAVSIEFVDNSKISFKFTDEITDDAIEAVRAFLNDSEIVVRIVENAIETSTNNPDLIGMFVKGFENLKISEYYDFSDLDFRNEHKLGDEVANLLYIARNFITEDFKVTLDLGILDEEMFEIIETNINNSTLIPYLVNVAAQIAVDYLGFTFQDVEVLVKSLVNLDDVDLLSIEYGSEVVKFLRTAMIFKVYGKNQFELNLRLTENDILTIADNIGTSELVQIALEKGIIAGLKLFGLDDEITLDDIRFDEIVIRDEIYHLLSAVRILEIDLKDIIGSLNLSIIDVENINTHLSESKILRYVTPVALAYVIEHSEELFKIDVKDYVDPAYLDLDEINWSDEIVMVLALAASMVDNYSGEFVIDLNISEAEADLIESTMNNSKLLPQLIPYFMDNIDKYVAASVMDMVANFVDVSALDLVDGVNLGTEVVGLLRVANEVIDIKLENNSKISFEINKEITDELIEAIRAFLNDSEIVVRVVENAIETSTNNPDLIGMFVKGFDNLKISEYYDFSDLDFRNEHKLGDEVANLLYIGRNFITEDFKITLDFGNLDEDMYEIIETNINNSTLIPYLVNVAAHVAVDYLGFKYQDVEVLVKSLVNLDDVDLLSIEYGSEIVKFLRSAMIFKVYGKNQFELNLRLTENDILTIADNIGTSELVQIALEKGIIAGLKLFGLDDEITLDDIRFDEIVIRDEIYHLLSAVRILEIDLEDIIGSLNLTVIDVENISAHLGESKILEYVTPVALAYIFEHSEELLKINLKNIVDLDELNIDSINWADEITMVLALAASVVDNYSGKLTVDLHISDAEATLIESSVNKSELLKQLIPYFIDNIDRFVAKSVMDMVGNYIDVSALDLVDGVNLGREVVGLLKIANEVVEINLVDNSKISYKITNEITDGAIEVVRVNLNNSEILARVAENAVETATNNPDLLGMFLNSFKNVAIAEYHDFSDLDFRNVHKLGDEIAAVLSIARHFLTSDYKIAFDLDAIDDEAFEDIKKGLNSSKLVPYLAEAAAYIATDYLEMRIGDTDVLLNKLIDLSDVEFDEFEYGDEAVKFIKIAQIFYKDQKFELKYDFTLYEIHAISNGLGTSEIFRTALEKGIKAGLELYGLDDSIKFEDLEFDTWNLENELESILNIVNTLDVDLSAPLTMLQLSDSQITTITDYIRMSKIIEVALPIAIGYAADNSETLFKLDVAKYFDTSAIDYEVIDWGNEFKFILSAARHFIDNDGKFVFSTDMDFMAIIDDVYTSLNNSTLIPQVLNIGLDVNSELMVTVGKDTYKIKEFINKDKIDFTDYSLGDEIKRLSDVARIYLDGIELRVDLDLTYAQYNTIEAKLNGSALLKDLLGNALDTMYWSNVFNMNQFLDLSSDFSFESVENWGTELVNVARLAAKHIDFTYEGNAYSFFYSLDNVNEDDIDELERTISESDLLPVLLSGAIRALDTNSIVNDLLEKALGVEVYQILAVDHLELDFDWGEEIAALARVALVYLENGSFVLRYSKTDDEIKTIETNLAKSGLIKEVLPLVFDGFIGNYETIMSKLNINLDIDDYIDITELSLEDIDIAKEVGIVLRLASPIFDEVNKIIFTIDSMDEDFIENVRVQINESDLIPYLAGKVYDKVIVEDTLNLKIADYVDLDGFTLDDYLLGDEIAHLLKIVKIFDSSDGFGFGDIRVALRVDLTDDEIGIIEEEVNASALINNMIPRAATKLYNDYQEPGRYINLDGFDYSKYSYGSEIAVILKVAREVITIDGSSLDFNSYKYDFFNLSEESIENIGDAISESELIPDLVPLAIERIPNFKIAGHKISSIVDVVTLLEGINDINYGKEAKIALRLAKVYDSSVNGTEIVSISDDAIETIRANVNASDLVRLVAEAAVKGLVSSNEFNINNWIILSELDLDVLDYGDEIAELLYVAREFFDFDTQQFSVGALADLTEEEVDAIAEHLNASKLVEQALPIAIRLLDSNTEIDKYINFNFRDYIDLYHLDLEDVKFGDEFRIVFKVAGLFTEDYVDYSFNIKGLTEDDITLIETQLNASVLIPRVILNAVTQDAVKTLYDIDDYVDLDLVDFKKVSTWGSEIASVLRVAQLLVNEDMEIELRFRFEEVEIDLIEENVRASVLIPEVLNAAVETVKETNIYYINDWVDLDDLDTSKVDWASEIATALVILGYYSSEDGMSVNINSLTEAQMSEIRTRINASEIVKQLAPGAIEKVAELDPYYISDFVDLTAVSYDDIVWGDEIYYALGLANHFIIGFGEYDINYANITDEIRDSVRALGNNSKLIERLAPVAIETSMNNNVYEVNYWVDLSVVDTEVISWGDEAAELLRIAQIFSDGYEYFIKYNFTEDEIETVREVANSSQLVKMLAPSAINTLGEVNRFDVLTYAADLADMDFTAITAWGDELASAMQVLNVVMYEDGYVKIFYPFSDEEITIVKDAVNASKLVPLVAPEVIETFDEYNLFDINLYVNLAGLDFSSVKWGDEVELALQVISYFSPNEGSFELLFNSLTDDQIDRLSELAGQSTLIPLVAPRAVSNAFDYGHFDIYEWLDESAFDYDAIDYAKEVKAALIVLKELTDEFGEFIFSINFTDEQIAAVKEAIAMSDLVGMLVPSFVEHASTNYLTIASDLIDYTVFDYDKIVYADEVEKIMKVVRLFADEDEIFHFNVSLLDEDAIETVAINLGSSEIINQAAESVIENALEVFEVPYIEFADMDFTDVDYTVEIRTLLKLFKLVANEDGEVSEEQFDFETLKDKAEELGTLVAQSQLLTSALPYVIPRALPYDEETFPYDLSEVDYDSVVWSSEVESLIKLLALVGASLEGDFEFDLETATRDDVVELGGYLSETLIGQFIFGQLVKDAIVGFEFAGLTEDDLDYENITNWGDEVVRLYDIIQIITDDEGNSRDFATLNEEEVTALAQALGTSELFTPILEDVVINTIEEGGFDDIVSVDQLYFGTEVDPIDWVNELEIFLTIYRSINDIDFDNFGIDDLDNAESLLIDMMDSEIMYTYAYPYIFSNVAVKMGLDSIEGANFEVEYLKTEVHAYGKTAWENEITTLIDLYREVDDLGGIDAIETLSLKSIKDSGKSVSVVFSTITNLILDSKILGVPTLQPIIVDIINLGEDSHGNQIPLANTDDWTITEWRTEIAQLTEIINTLGAISEDYDFADVNLDINEEEHNRNIGSLLNQAYDSALIGNGINTKITDIILGYTDINEYVDASAISEVRGLKPGTAEEGWIGEISILQALRATAEAYELGDPESVSTLSKADLASILTNMKNSHITNYGLPKVVKNALIGVGIDDMLDYGLGAGEPSRFDALPFDMVKDHSNNEIDKLVELFSSVQELGDLADINWSNEGTTELLSDVIINLVKTDLFNGYVAIPTTAEPATEEDPDVLLLSGIFRNANLADTLDAVKIITIAGDDIVNEDTPDYVRRLETELDLIIDIKNELFVDGAGEPSDTMNHNKISAELLKKLNASDILLDDALPRILKEGLKTVGFDVYVNSAENPNAFDTMNFAAIKDDAEIDLLMGLYDFAKSRGDLSSVEWDSMPNSELVDQLETVTTSNVIMPVRGIIVDNVLTDIGFSAYYLPSDITAVDAADAWDKEIKAIEMGLDLTKSLNDSSSKGLTSNDSNTYLIRAVMETADEAIVMNRILRGVLDEQMVALGVGEEQFRWSKANRSTELDLGDTAPALAGLIDLTKLMKNVKEDTATTKLANNMFVMEDAYDISKPDYHDPLTQVNAAERIFASLDSVGKPDGRTLVDILMEIFIAEALPGTADKFAGINWATIDYTAESTTLQFAALTDSNYDPDSDRDTMMYLVELLDRIYTVNPDYTFSINSPFAAAFITATDAKLELTANEIDQLETVYIGINPIKDQFARTIYKFD